MAGKPLAVPQVPPERLKLTPSREAGVARGTERRLRIFGVDQIQRAAQLLRLPQTSAVSAAAVFQRFYFRRSLVDFDVRITAAAALLLACKLEETHRRLKDVIVVFLRLRSRAQLREAGPEACAAYAGRPAPYVDVDSPECLQMRREVQSVEKHILWELGFAVSALLEHPHKYVLQFVKSLKKSTDFVLCELAQTAWNYLNDSMRTPVCCMYQPHQIATAGIYLAARRLEIKLPSKPPWWEVFDTEPQDMRAIARRIARLYRRRHDGFVKLPGARRVPDVPPTPLCLDSPFPMPSPSPSPPPSPARGRSRSRSRGRQAVS